MIYLVKSFRENPKEKGKAESVLKIGFSQDYNWSQRLKQYETHNCGCKVLKTIRGGSLRIEQLIHLKFSEFKLEGSCYEWYYDVPEIRDWFNTITPSELYTLKQSTMLSKKENDLYQYLDTRKINESLEELEGCIKTREEYGGSLEVLKGMKKILDEYDKGKKWDEFEKAEKHLFYWWSGKNESIRDLIISEIEIKDIKELKSMDIRRKSILYGKLKKYLI